jgi:hypothetical protein
MKTKIYVASYVRGPAVPPHTSRIPGSASAASKNEIRWAFRVKGYRQPQPDSSPQEAGGHETARRLPMVLEAIAPSCLGIGDIVLVEAGQAVPVDGRIIEGAASVDVASITGQSSQVTRAADGNREIMCDTRVISGRILVEVTPRRGHPLDWIDGEAAAAAIGPRERTQALATLPAWAR